MPTTVFLSLGSNQGDRLGYLKRALDELNKTEKIVKVSSVYETAAWGKTDQADFLNLVVKLSTAKSAEALLNKLQAIEARLERERHERWGPRTIDLDILLYGDEVIETKHLSVPHPRLWERAFVLKPLVEIEPELQFQGKFLKDYLGGVENQVVTIYEPDQTDSE